jgi:hypothetical protein
MSWWENHYRLVEKSINTARNDAIAAVKKSFTKGKPTCEYLLHTLF